MREFIVHKGLLHSFLSNNAPLQKFCEVVTRIKEAPTSKFVKL